MAECDVKVRRALYGEAIAAAYLAEGAERVCAQTRQRGVQGHPAETAHAQQLRRAKLRLVPHLPPQSTHLAHHVWALMYIMLREPNHATGGRRHTKQLHLP